MGKSSRRKAAASDSRPPASPMRTRSFPWFAVIVGTILLAGLGTVGYLASQRSTVIGVAPEALKDHWHSAFSVYSCGELLPPTQDPEHGDGIHAHADGLIHIHPTTTEAAGPNATLGNYLSTVGATLTDDRYEPGPGEVPVVLDASEGCDGEPAELKLAVWRNGAFDGEPEIIQTGLADLRFEEGGLAITLALVPSGETIPISPQAENVNNPGDQ